MRALGHYFNEVFVRIKVVVPLYVVIVLAWHRVPFSLIGSSQLGFGLGGLVEVVLFHAWDEGREDAEADAYSKAGDSSNFESCKAHQNYL